MAKSKKQKRATQVKRRQMIEDVFKKGKKQREVAKKFDEKIAQKQGSLKKREKFSQMKRQKRENTVGRDQVMDLDKRFDAIRAERRI